MPLPSASFLPGAILTALVCLATACGSSATEGAEGAEATEGTEGTDLSQADLEQQVAGRYEPDDPKDELTVSCEGALRGAEDATQDCLVTTGSKEVGIRASVTDVAADDLGLATTAFLPPEMVADAIASSLEIQGYEEVVATCDGDLMGEVGDAVVCEVTTPDGDTMVDVDVTSVEGLLINFDFKSA